MSDFSEYDRKQRQRNLHDSADGEQVFVLLAGVPYPARVTPIPTPAEQAAEAVARGLDVSPGEFDDDAPNSLVANAEVVILTEEVGKPSDGYARTMGYFPLGTAFVGHDLGERHPTTGRRVLVPVNYLGEVVKD